MKRKKSTPARAAASPRQKRLRPKASTADVLGHIPAQIEVPPKWRKSYKRLIELRAHLQQNKELLTRDALEERPTFSQHMADAGTDHFDRDLALSLISSEQQALYEIEQALNRIKNGTYGICEATGKRIVKERLEAIPWARFSTEAEKELEMTGGITRTRMADSERIPRITETPPAEED